MNTTGMSSARVAAWLQTLYIASFILLTYAYNLLVGGDPNFVNSLAASSCLVGLFYGYCYLVRCTFIARKSKWALALLTLTTVGIPLMVYVLVYVALPAVGVVLYKPHVPFRPGEFLGKAVKALIIPWVGVALYAVFYRKQQAMRRNEELRVQHTRKQQQVVELKIKQREGVLQSHHFRNCLNSIVSRAVDLDDDYIPSLMPHLSGVLDYSMEGSDSPDFVVTVERELESLHWLINSLRLRLKYDGVVIVRQTGTPQGQLLPRLSLATLFENVTKHGIVNLAKPVTVTIEIHEDRFCFTCVNFIKPGASTAERGGRGLRMLEVFLAQMKHAKGTLEHHFEADKFIICLTIIYDP